MMIRENDVRLNDDSGNYIGAQMARTGGSRIASVKMQHEPAAEADRPRSRLSAAAVSESPVWSHASNHIFLYKCMRNPN